MPASWQKKRKEAPAAVNRLCQLKQKKKKLAKEDPKQDSTKLMKDKGTVKLLSIETEKVELEKEKIKEKRDLMATQNTNAKLEQLRLCLEIKLLEAQLGLPNQLTLEAFPNLDPKIRSQVNGSSTVHRDIPKEVNQSEENVNEDIL